MSRRNSRSATPEEPGDRPRFPPGVEVLWGLRSKPQRGPKPELSVDAIVDAAMALADAGGLEAVSMASVAKKLGFTTMSLYRHVAGKEELLALMWNGNARAAESLVLTGEGWRARLKEWAIVQRRAIDLHPWITQMPMASPPMAPNSAAFVEIALAAMDDTPLEGQAKLLAIGLLSSYTLSEARMAYDARRAAEAALADHPLVDQATQPPGSSDRGSEAGPTDYEGYLRLLLDEETYPRLYRLVWEAVDRPPADEWASYEAGLDLILDGVEAMIERAR